VGDEAICTVMEYGILVEASAFRETDTKLALGQRAQSDLSGMLPAVRAQSPKRIMS
jgi:hypothetical protein